MSGGNSGVKVPVLLGFFWRPLKLSDAPALHTLQKECASFAYFPPPKTFEKLYAEMENAAGTLPEDSLCAADADGRLAASGTNCERLSIKWKPAPGCGLPVGCGAPGS